MQRSGVSDLEPRFELAKRGSKSLVPLRYTRVWNDVILDSTDRPML